MNLYIGVISCVVSIIALSIEIFHNIPRVSIKGRGIISEDDIFFGFSSATNYTFTILNKGYIPVFIEDYGIQIDKKYMSLYDNKQTHTVLPKSIIEINKDRHVLARIVKKLGSETNNNSPIPIYFYIKIGKLKRKKKIDYIKI